MLKLIYHMKDLNFTQLLEVYEESVRRPYAQEQLYNYLYTLFADGGACAVWIRDGVYISALRLERYKDGFLIAGLETVPKERRKGYGTMLLNSLCQWASGDRIKALYSHVKNCNRASVRVHEKCGFIPILDYAVFLDGSVDTRSKTLYLKLQKSCTDI